MRWQPRSLFSNLLAWSLAALGLLWLSFIAAGYQSGRHETDELVDGQLASVAALVALVAQMDERGRWLPAEAAPLNRPVWHEYQQAISLVVWDGEGRLLARHGAAPLPPFTRSEGFATLQLGAPPQAWRSFARWTDGAPARRVMVLIDAAERNELGWDIAGQVAAPGLWLLPALALGLGLALRRGLQPLQALSDDVQALQVAQHQGLHNAHPAAEFRAMVAAINTLVQRYHAALARERELASELAHELRTPLSALVLQARALRETPNSGDRAAHTAALVRLEQDALRAGQVLTELLALARASHAALAEAAQPVDLAAVAQQLLAERAEAALAAGHDLALVGDAGLTVQGHALLLGLALGNLVDNALAHSSGPTLVELRLDAGSRCLQVCNGPSPGSTVADPAAAAGASPALGLGLGHRVVAKVAELHGARFAAVPAPPGFVRCYELCFAPAAAGPGVGQALNPPAP
jgi:two-component system sensor histidine kinase QseC